MLLVADFYTLVGREQGCVSRAVADRALRGRRSCDPSGDLLLASLSPMRTSVCVGCRSKRAALCLHPINASSHLHARLRAALPLLLSHSPTLPLSPFPPLPLPLPLPAPPPSPPLLRYQVSVSTFAVSSHVLAHTRITGTCTGPTGQQLVVPRVRYLARR
jgi:hypothetical protein